MNARYRVFALAALVLAFLVPSAGAWEGIYTRPEKDESGNAIRVIYKETQDGEIRLSDPKFDNGNPVWSPDGTEIAFDSKRNGFEEVFVMDADGQNARSFGRGTYPAISRNYVAFTFPLGNRSQFRVVRRDGSGDPVDLGFVSDFGSISPDETRVVFWNGSDDLVLANIDGSGSRRLVSGTNPSFIDNGTIVFQRGARGDEVWVYDLLADTGRRLVEEFGADPTATSDGWVVFSGLDGWTAIRPDGTEETVLAAYTRQGGFRVTGPIADTRPVEPRGKAAVTLGEMKRNN